MKTLQDLMEQEAYLEDRSAFWLFPDRWEGVEPGGLMAFDDGSWEPPPPPELCCSRGFTEVCGFCRARGGECLFQAVVQDEMCPRCFSYRCEGCGPPPGRGMCAHCGRRPASTDPHDWGLCSTCERHWR